ncbi:MAG: hypothetical protein WA061_03170 [Microgenomates group bacterium]
MKNDGEMEYKSRDLGECGALVTSGQKVINIQRDGKIVWFVFEHTEECENVSREYFFGSLKGDLHKYNEAMNTLKNCIYSYIR